MFGFCFGLSPNIEVCFRSTPTRDEFAAHARVVCNWTVLIKAGEGAHLRGQYDNELV